MALAQSFALGTLSLVVALTFAGGVIDDAYISLRYAARLASGQGLSFNPGPPTEGFTNLSWTLLAALAERAHVAPLAVWFVVGVLCAVALTELTRRRARALAPTPGAADGWTAGLAVALSIGIAMYANSGLETVPFALAHTLAVAALADRRGAAFAAWTSLAFMTRPEAGLTGLVGAAILAWEARHERAIRAELARALVVFALLVAPLLVWKRWYFGAWLPLTLAAKPPDRAFGLRYALPFVLYGSGLVLGALHAVVKGGPARRTYGLFGLLGIAAGVLEGGDWMPLHRLLLPSLPLLAIAADGWVVASIEALRSPARRLTFRLAAVIPLALVALWVGRNLQGIPDIQQWMSLRQATDEVRASFARELVTGGARSIALVDIGVVGTSAPSLRVVDLGGLTEPALARAPGGHLDKDLDPGWFLGASPDLVAFNNPAGLTADPSGRSFFAPQFGVENRLLNAPWFRARYGYACTVNVARVYLLHVFRRHDAVLTLPPRCAPIEGLVRTHAPARPR